MHYEYNFISKFGGMLKSATSSIFCFDKNGFYQRPCPDFDGSGQTGASRFRLEVSQVDIDILQN